MSGFYQRLYDKVEVENVESDDFYSNCPKLSPPLRAMMDAELTNEELFPALLSCFDSAPGSDCFPYSVYKKLRGIVGW